MVREGKMLMYRKQHIVLIQICKPSLITEKYSDRYPYPPIGLMYLEGILRMNGYEVTIIDFYLERLKKKDFIVKLRKLSKPLLFGLSSYTDSIEQAYRVANTIKEIYPDVPILLGGTHVSFMYNDVMRECRSIDFACVGEGEGLIVELLEYLQNGRPLLSEINNLVYRDETGRVIVNKKRGYVTALDIFPLLDYSKNYIDIMKETDGLVFISSRGCPGNCIFCASRAFSGPKYRYHSAEWIISLIYYYKQKIGFHVFGPLDDTFTVNKSRLEKFVNYLEKFKIGIPWACKSRVDVLNEEIVGLLKRGNCLSVHIGVESGDSQVLKDIKKNITLEQVMNSLRLLVKNGIRAECSFIIGHPTDTLESIEKTIILASKLDNTNFSLSVVGICTPFPGTTIWNNAEEYKIDIHTYNWKSYDLGTPIFSTENFTLDDLKRAYFYFNYESRVSPDKLPNLSGSNLEEYKEKVEQFVNDLILLKEDCNKVLSS